MPRLQLSGFNSGERGRSARLMGAQRPHAQAQGLKSRCYPGTDLRRQFKIGEVRYGTGGGSTAERTVVKMGVGIRMMVVMRRHRQRGCRGTQLQQKRRPARRHEAGGDVGSKQQQRQQEAGLQVLSPAIEGKFAHRHAGAGAPLIERNFLVAAMPSAMKAIKTTPCATAKGGSFWVGARA